MSELKADSKLAGMILAMYEQVLAGKSLKELLAAADEVKASSIHDII